MRIWEGILPSISFAVTQLICSVVCFHELPRTKLSSNLCSSNAFPVKYSPENRKAKKKIACCERKELFSLFKPQA